MYFMAASDTREQVTGRTREPVLQKVAHGQSLSGQAATLQAPTNVAMGCMTQEGNIEPSRTRKPFSSTKDSPSLE